MNEKNETSHRCAGSRPAQPLVLCAGMTVVDLMFRVDRFPSPSTKAMAREFFLTGGGNAANAAIAITRLGGRARFCGPVGDDEFGQRVLDGLVKEGVDIGGAQRVEGAATSVSGIFVDPAGERLLTTRRAQGLEKAPPPKNCARLVEGAGAVLADNHFPDFAAPICRAARERNIPVDLAAALERASAFCRGFVAATDGAAGALWHDGHALRRQEAFAVNAVDTLAAGDVFHAAFTLALAEGRAEAKALRFASAAAALKCARFGGIAGAPTRAEVEHLLMKS